MCVKFKPTVDSTKFNIDKSEQAKAITVTPEKEKTVALKKDQLETSGVQKNAVWEGVKFGAKREALIGLAAGGIGLGGTVFLGSKIVGAFNNTGAGWGAFGAKPILIATGIGLVGGALYGAASGAIEGAITGKIVENSSKKAVAKGKDAESHVKLVLGGTGAVIGGALSISSSLKLTNGIANPWLKGAATVGLIAVSAVGSGLAAAHYGEEIYNRANS